MSEPQVIAHSAPDALETAKKAARSDGFAIKGVGRVDAVDMARDLWRVTLTVAVRTPQP